MPHRSNYNIYLLLKEKCQLLLAGIFFAIFLPVLAEGESADLASTSEWLALGHYEASSKKSYIDSADFFLSAEGRSNPERELEITRELFDKALKVKNYKIICQYPARYIYLSKVASGYDLDALENCKDFKEWEELILSLIHI